ncbi:MAG: hypothetical protein IJN77_09860 [Oscillospiraceae bacterium]|nr:hypothetical protein [Oscillospiraceae bacterium]
MMKKYLYGFILIIVFLFSSCSANQSVMQPDSKQYESLSIQTSSSEEVSLKELLKTSLDNLNLVEFFYYGYDKDFSSAGLTVEIIERQIIDEYYAGFTIKINNGVSNLILPVKAEYIYRTDGYYTPIADENVQWGNIDISDSGIVVARYDFDKNYSVLEHYNTDTLELINSIKFTDIPDLRLLSATVYKDGYAAQYFKSETDKGLAILDNNGNIVQQIKYSGYNTSYGYQNNSDLNFNSPYSLGKEKIRIFSDDLIFVGKEDIFSLSKSLSGCYKKQCQYNDGDTKFELYTKSGGSADLENHFAVLYSQDKVTDLFFSNNKNIHEAFASEDSNYKPSEYKLSSDGRIMTINCDITQLTLTVDFDRKTLTDKYNITEDRLTYEYETSPDGRITLHGGASAGGGDYWVSALVAKDNATGQLKYLGCPGGMYGGGNDFGFLKNGDIYIFSRAEFTVFSSDLNVKDPIFTMSDNFSLGRVDEQNIDYRYLFAVRRDPQTFGYTVVFADVPYYAGARYPDIDISFNSNNNYTYKVGLLDANGRLYKHINTDIDVKITPFGYMNMDMYLQRDNLMHMTTMVKSGVYDDFTVDISTGKITNLLAEKYETEIIKSASDIIIDAHMFTHSFKNGDIVNTDIKLSETDNPYPGKTQYFQMKDEYITSELLKNETHKYYAEYPAEYYLYRDLTTESVKFPYIIEYNGKIWLDINQCEKPDKKIFDVSTITLESITEENAIISVQYHTENNGEKCTAYYNMNKNYDETGPAWLFGSLVM